ncbi:hypothetical protein OF001_U190045 [Pseudomonas sp. OF001]|nr:hypothetical protein OF001_U190045 [Pseudomonas sp. OF001]
MPWICRKLLLRLLPLVCLSKAQAESNGGCLYLWLLLKELLYFWSKICGLRQEGTFH